jgi:GNAT superfamily N-acetyltransferase
MVPPVVIRAAVPDDAPGMADLAGELGYPVTPSGMKLGLEEAGCDPRHAVFVAEAGSLVGWIHVTQVLSLESGTCAEIRGLVVESSHRRSGIGRRLVIAAEEWALRYQCPRIRVRTNIVREEAARFYGSLGYDLLKTQAVFDKRLHPQKGASPL